jgi:iron complex transport system substrate-binding protein
MGDCWAMGSAEEILRLKPTLVIGSVPYKSETVAQLLEHPINFLAMNPRTLDDVYADVRLLGGIVQRSRQAETLIRRMQSTFTSIAESAAKRTGSSPGFVRPRVYCEAWSNPRISSPPWVAELVQIAGGEFVTRPGSKVSDQEVATGNPDIIVLAWAAVGDRSKPQRAFAVPAWKNVSAIRNRQVHVVRDEWLNTPGPPLLLGIRRLAAIVRQWRRGAADVQQ